MPSTDRRPPTAMPTPALPLFDPRWPVELQRTYTQLASRRINARRGVPDPTLSRDLAAANAAITALPTHHHDTQEPTMPTTNGHPPTPGAAPAPLTAPATTPSSTFDAAQWETLTAAARHHALSQIERATAQRATLATEITQLQQTAAALDRALLAFRQPAPTPATAPPAPRAHGEALRQALEWADSHGGLLDTRLYQRTSGRPALSYSTLRRLAARGLLVHVGSPKSGRYRRPTQPEPPEPPEPPAAPLTDQA